MDRKVMTEQLELHLQQTPGLYAGSVDDKLRPETTRVLLAVAEPGTDVIRFVVANPFSQRFLACVASQPRVALVATIVHNYAALQFKGRVLETLPATEADLAGVEAYAARFGELVAHVGIDPAQYLPTWVQGPYTTVRLEVESVFDQTPKLGAGARVRGLADGQAAGGV